MHNQPRLGVEGDWLIDRRSLLTGALAALLGAGRGAAQPDQAQSEEDQELRAVEAIATKAGLAAFGTTRSVHYLGIGDASETFRSLALRDCEAVAADYLDFYRTQGFKELGQPHEPNLYALVRARRFGPPWYPFAQLLADDRTFVLSSDSRLQQLAYAQAWLLIDYLMKHHARREAFRAYLEAIRPRTGPEHRLDDAKKHLGDLDRLNQDLVSYFVRLNRAL
jgi:hypothetical protein